LDIQADGFLSVFSPNGDIRTDLRLEEDEPISERCRHLFDEGSSVAVWILESMGEERICGVKELSD
jgi:hypothetical protein